MTIDVQMLQLIPFGYALTEWRKLSQELRNDYQPAQRFIPSRYVLKREELKNLLDYRPPVVRHGDCPICDGGRFVRFSFPYGHKLFGHPVCCQRCWPEPFGNAPGLIQSDTGIEIENKWKKHLGMRNEE